MIRDHTATAPVQSREKHCHWLSNTPISHQLKAKACPTTSSCRGKVQNCLHQKVQRTVSIYGQKPTQNIIAGGTCQPTGENN
ncbi:hypothetical protein Nepgr_030052 [Nepenthes gracilis]|uniref:Uncharacterized protein n=1 Tax=Nepenthes gracilis TaxID=150966 RepID=A0AAD3TFG9_NEPGR|nr:hypothetical protein Nepgr_030052 [Nepenthes gracilis]